MPPTTTQLGSTTSAARALVLLVQECDPFLMAAIFQCAWPLRQQAGVGGNKADYKGRGGI